MFYPKDRFVNIHTFTTKNLYMNYHRCFLLTSIGLVSASVLDIAGGGG